ncbi:MAG: histidine phosphatase family protein [Pirellulales bacterium]|nr:histidine phosphatase family protein [Pirellulales bacterium]
MLQIVLIRPGRTDYDAQERIQGTLDIPLSEEGQADAAQTAELLREKAVEAIYASACEPSHQTAEIIAEALDVKLRKLGLENINLGLWQGMRVDDVRTKQPKVYRQWQEQPETVCPPKGEMLGDAEERVRISLAKLLKKHKEGVIALCLPEPLLSLARRLITREELGDLWKPRNGHGPLEVLQVAPAEAPALS